jgi:thiol-disulfide isomerase/thioredoxin
VRTIDIVLYRKTKIMIRYSITVTIFALTMCLSQAFAAGNSTKGVNPLHISFGEEIKLEDYLVAGKTTVFDFYSDYCPPCRAFAPYLEKLHKTRGDVAVVIVEINRSGVRGIDWKSPVARQYKISFIPYLRIYDAEGKLIADGEEATKKIGDWLKE